MAQVLTPFPNQGCRALAQSRLSTGLTTNLPTLCSSSPPCNPQEGPAPPPWPAGVSGHRDITQNCSLLAHPGGMAGRKLRHEQGRLPSVDVNHAVAAGLSDSECPVKEGLLWQERGPRSPGQQDRNTGIKGVGAPASGCRPRRLTQPPSLTQPSPQLPAPTPAPGCPSLPPRVWQGQPGQLLWHCFEPF